MSKHQCVISDNAAVPSSVIRGCNLAFHSVRLIYYISFTILLYCIQFTNKLYWWQNYFIVPINAKPKQMTGLNINIPGFFRSIIFFMIQVHTCQGIKIHVYSYKKKKNTLASILDYPMPPLTLKFQFYAGYPFHYSLDFYFFFFIFIHVLPSNGYWVREFLKRKKKALLVNFFSFNFFLQNPLI